jgi:hypothetical protein
MIDKYIITRRDGTMHVQSFLTETGDTLDSCKHAYLFYPFTKR